MNLIDAMMVNLGFERHDAGAFRRFIETHLHCLCELPQKLDDPRFDAALAEMAGARIVFARSSAPFEMRWAEHGEAVFCGLVISGGIEFSLAETVICRRGEALAVGTESPWRASVRPGTQFCAISFRKQASDRLLERLSGRPAIEPLDMAAPFRSTSSIGRMLAALVTAAVAGTAEDGPLGRAAYTSEVLEQAMLALLLENLPHNHAAGIMRGRDEALPWPVRKAVEFIAAHARREISVAEVSAAAGTSVRALQQNFQRSLKLSPQDYIKTVRLQGAHRELLDPASPRSIEEIATAWGFVNRGHFATQYRKAFGQLPSQTRRSR